MDTVLLGLRARRQWNGWKCIILHVTMSHWAEVDRSWLVTATANLCNNARCPHHPVFSLLNHWLARHPFHSYHLSSWSQRASAMLFMMAACCNGTVATYQYTSSCIRPLTRKHADIPTNLRVRDPDTCGLDPFTHCPATHVKGHHA